MKKSTLLFALAAIIGIGSAVATTTKGIGDEYVKIGSTYELRSLHPDGGCLPSADKCSYTKTGTASTPSLPQDQNPANFTVDEPGTWTE